MGSTNDGEVTDVQEEVSKFLIIRPNIWQQKSVSIYQLPLLLVYVMIDKPDWNIIYSVPYFCYIPTMTNPFCRISIQLGIYLVWFLLFLLPLVRVNLYYFKGYLIDSN